MEKYDGRDTYPVSGSVNQREDGSGTTSTAPINTKPFIRNHILKRNDERTPE